MAVAERLPLERQQTMALQIAEGAVVGEDVEPVGGAFEGAARFVATIGPVAVIGAQQLRAVVGRHRSRDPLQLIVGERRCRVESRGDDLGFAVRVEVRQRHLVTSVGVDAGDVPSASSSNCARVSPK